MPMYKVGSAIYGVDDPSGAIGERVVAEAAFLSEELVIGECRAQSRYDELLSSNIHLRHEVHCTLVINGLVLFEKEFKYREGHEKQGLKRRIESRNEVGGNRWGSEGRKIMN